MNEIEIRPVRWSGVHTIGTTAVSIRTGWYTGFMFMDRQHWCEPCGRICWQHQFALMVPGNQPGTMRAEFGVPPEL